MKLMAGESTVLGRYRPFPRFILCKPPQEPRANNPLNHRHVRGITLNIKNVHPLKPATS